MARQVIKQNEDQVVKWINEGWSMYKISQELGCKSSSVRKFLEKRGIHSKHKCKVDYTNLLKDREDEVVQLYNSGKTCDDIAKITGHSAARISVLIKSSDQEVREWKYSVNEHFFDKVSNEVVAYALGWFYSDGCVDDVGKMRIQIQKDDEAILYTIKDAMEYNGPLYEVLPPKKFPDRKPQVCLCISRKVLADKLISLGCIPNKSLKLKFPSFDIVSKKLLPHFIRGVFDGDGGISIKGRMYFSVSITSCEDFINPLCSFLSTDLQIDTHTYYRHTNTNTLQMSITQSDNGLKFLDWIYKDATYYLDRKFQKYQLCKKNF